MDVIWTKFNRMCKCKLCLNTQSNHIGGMKKHHEKCVKQPVSLSRMRCVTQLQFLFPNPRQLSKPRAQLLSSSVLIHRQPRSVKLTSTVMWCGLQQLPKMTWMTRLLSSYMGVACHSASLNIPSSCPWCPVFVQVISHLPDMQ